MWGASDEPPGTMEGGPPESMIQPKESCEQNKNQLEMLKEIMIRNKQSLKKKEEEVQEYARRLSKIKQSRRSKEGSSHSKDPTLIVKSDARATENVEDTIDDISQAKTPKAKSSLLQRKLAENRKVFEQRSKEMTETKRAVEEKVEAIRQQLDERSVAMEMQRELLPITPVRPIMVTSEVVQLGHIPDTDGKVAELNNKILELEATIIDLRENLKEKDSVIESKTMAVTLMSADLSKKGKTTLDTLEDTKDEMRTMQEHFVLMETSLKSKNENLLEQLHERDSRILELESLIKGLEHQVEERKLAESTSAGVTRSTMDTLADTKDIMKSMQENFVLIESSLKLKNDNLLQQLEDYEVKMAEANERIFHLESGAGIVKAPEVEDLLIKIERYEQSNRQLQDEKYELQKSIAEMQNKMIANKSVHSNGAIQEKDNRIAELENLIDELKRSNQLLEEESKTELQKQLAELSVKNDEYSNKIVDLERMVHDLEVEKNELASRLSDETVPTKDDEKVLQLTKELDELNKSMIKTKAQHRSKVKNLQKQLDNFKMISDANAELVRLGNQVALLEEEKGNLQLSLVDFDELKAAAGDWQERIIDLESKVSSQTKEIQMHVDAIAILENQKLDLMQELHVVKQEVSALEAENAESENLRVTAEMKVVDLEEQLDSLHKSRGDSKTESMVAFNQEELLQRIETLTQQNSELFAKLSKLEEKGTSDTGSTESFETIQDADRNELLKRIEELAMKNNELTLKLSKVEEKDGSQAGSTESFEAIADTDKNELLKKIEQLTQENNDLLMKLSRGEEKGSSDTGSTESFERIPEHNESVTKIELLTQENNDLVIKLTKLEEKLGYMESGTETLKSDANLVVSGDTCDETLIQENNNLSTELTKLQMRVTELTEENVSLQKRVEQLMEENSAVLTRTATLEEQLAQLGEEKSEIEHRLKKSVHTEDELNILIQEREDLQKKLLHFEELIKQQSDNDTQHERETSDMKSRMDALVNENSEIVIKLKKLEESNDYLKENLDKVTRDRDALEVNIDELQLTLIDKLEKCNQEKESVAQEKQELRKETSTLLHKSNEELSDARKVEEVVSEKQERDVVVNLESEIEGCKKLIAEQSGAIEEMKRNLASKEEHLEKMTRQIMEYEAREVKDENLTRELKEMQNTIEEWKFKCNDIQLRMDTLAAAKASIEADLNTLQGQNKNLVEESEQSQLAMNTLKEQLESTISQLETKLHQEIAILSTKEQEILHLKDELNNKDEELHKKYAQLQNEMIAIDTLQDDLNACRLALQEKNETVRLLSETVDGLRETVKTNEEEIYLSKKANDDLYNKLQKSRPVEEYDELLERLRDREVILRQLQDKIDEYVTENTALLTKNEKLTADKEAVQSELVQREQEFSNLTVVTEHLNAQIADSEAAKTEAEKRASSLQSVLDKNAKRIDDLQLELKNGYLLLEQLKIKHTEDMEMQNRSLEKVIEDLNAKLRENEVLRAELNQKDALIGQNVTEEMKNTLETQNAELQQKLAESETKIQAQLEKMKKIAAALKKKTAMCQELEGRVVELEQKWTTEKDEKEAKNKKIQEVESAMREKDNKIAELEERLEQMRNETTGALTKADELETELRTSKEKMMTLIEQITEMSDEIEKLRANAENLNAELAAEKEAKQKILAEYEERLVQETESKQAVLDEVKENARELSVRMEVMEKRYVEQLSQIKNLEAENGLLLSKHAQINEKLENTEKESEERQALVEQLRREIASTVSTGTQAPAEDSGDDESRLSGVQHCEHCEQCQTVVMALEAKLQERQAEIENLDNELANSIGNMYHMRTRSVGFNDAMNGSNVASSNLVESYNNLLFQYNSLMTSNEEIKTKLDDTARENKELLEKIESLQALNVTLEERIVSVEQELMQDKGATENTQNVDTLYADLVKKHEQQDADLRLAHEEVQAARDRFHQYEQELASRTSQFNTERQSLTEKYESLCRQKDNLLQEIEATKTEKDTMKERISLLESELSEEKRKNMAARELEKSKLLNEGNVSESHVVEGVDNAPKLFDASKIFGMSSVPGTDQKETTRLQNLLSEKEAQNNALTKDFSQLQKQIVEERLQMTQNYDRCLNDSRIAQERCHEIQLELERAQNALTEKNTQVETLSTELSNVQTQMKTQLERQKEYEEKFQAMVSMKDKEIEELSIDLNSTKGALELLSTERNDQDQSLEACKLQIASLKTELRNVTGNDSVSELKNRISIVLKEKDFLMLQINDLTRALEDSKHSAGKVRELETKIADITRERDATKEEIVELTRALKEHKSILAAKAEILHDDSATHVIEEQTSVDTAHSVDTLKPVEESFQQSVHLEVSAAWDSGSNEKLNVDEDTWGWNAEDAQLAEDQQMSASSLIPSKEMQLQAKVDELQDRINELEAEKAKMTEDNKVAQIRSGKLVKRLKEYKAQTENLQQQLKIQKSAGEFCELDSAIEEELKSQIKTLEQSLSKLKEEYKNITTEKEALLQRLDVVVSANERYMEMKERQDMDVDVLRIQNKELSNKLQSLEWRLQERGSGSESTEPPSVPDQTERMLDESDKPIEHGSRQKREVDSLPSDVDTCAKHKAEIDDLKDEMEALATENEQLQHYLEEQKVKISSLESKLASNARDSIVLEESTRNNTELRNELDKTKQEYDVLRKQYEQSLMDANDQVTAMRQNSDLFKAELTETNVKLETEIHDLRQQAEEFASKVSSLEKELQSMREEKNVMEERIIALTNMEEKVTMVNSSLAEVTDLLNARVQEVAELKQELQRQYVDRDRAEARLQETIQALNQDLHDRKRELDNLGQAFSAKENELMQQKSIDTVSAVISQATQELSQRHAIEIEDKNKELQKLNEKLLTLQASIDEYLAALQRNAYDIDAQQQEANRLKQELLERDTVLNTTMSRLAAAEDELAKTQSIIIQQEEGFKSSALHTEGRLAQLEERVKNYEMQQQRDKQEIDRLQANSQRVESLETELKDKAEALNQLNMQVGQLKRSLGEKECLIETLNIRLDDKQHELDKLLNPAQVPLHPPSASSTLIDGLPVFKMGNDDDSSVQATIDELKTAMEVKQQEIERLKHILSENTYPRVIQEMQDRIDCIYEEKSQLEAALRKARQTLIENQKEIENLKQMLDVQRQEFVAKEEANMVMRDHRLTTDQEEILRLQNEIHTKEQTINELMYVMAEKDSQLSLQASMEPQSDEFELQETIQRLTSELYGERQFIQNLKATIAELQNEIARLKEVERFSMESKSAIERLTSEKEGIRVEAEQLLERTLKKKEMEIDEIKQKLSAENIRLLEELQLRDKDVENLRTQLGQFSGEWNQKLHSKEEELLHATAELAEKERRLAELSITKDAELHNLKVQIHEKDVRIEELLTLSTEEERQLSELRLTLEAREAEINSLKEQLDNKVKEFEMIQRALKKDVSVLDIQPSQVSEVASTSESKDIASNELDLALYMLHQRDVRCEELTHELMQLLEERDTLQLRLSNAIRVNEELRRAASADMNPRKDLSSSSGSDEPLIEKPSPSKSEGPIEIAKEAIHDPIGENKEALAEKLSQLHTVGHAKDVRLKDERELRHTQQMSLLAHKDVLSTLPPEAAARLVNANYTLSRDVQSQSSVLLNWLWGKSTPKVVHM